MKRMNKKGFTIVELVIVIAVITILAAVLIPTFSGVIESAHKSAALQKATASYKDAYAVALSDDGVITEDDGENGVITSGDIDWTCGAGALSTTDTIDGYSITVTNGKVSVSK